MEAVLRGGFIQSGYENQINQLHNQYKGDFLPEALAQHEDGSSKFDGFIGAKDVVHLSAASSITVEAPGCVAAPLVNLVAREAIYLGVNGQGSKQFPVRFYAPKHLSITAEHLFIGEVSFVSRPENGFISCKKLTLLKQSSCSEIVKNLLWSAETEIEIVES